MDRSDVKIAMGTSHLELASNRPTRRVALRCGLLAAVGFAVPLTPQVSEAKASVFDLRDGTFVGNWCGFEATFRIKLTDKKISKFTGTITLATTKQVDTITVQQLSDDSLYMLRYLSGAMKGETQGMQTHPPERIKRGGTIVVNWPAKRTYGYGAKLLGFLQMPVK